jgi:hypothetical protein
MENVIKIKIKINTKKITKDKKKIKRINKLIQVIMIQIFHKIDQIHQEDKIIIKIKTNH